MQKISQSGHTACCSNVGAAKLVLQHCARNTFARMKRVGERPTGQETVCLIASYDHCYYFGPSCIRICKLFQGFGFCKLAPQRWINSQLPRQLVHQNSELIYGCACFFKKWAIPDLFFGLFKQTLQFLQQINVKNIHPVYGAGIRTHNLKNTSLLP